MNTLRKIGLLPHEWFFGAFLVILWLRLLAARGFSDGDAMLYAALLAANVAVIAWCLIRKTKLSWLCRLWFYPVVINVTYLGMGTAVAKVTPHKWDGVLAECDRLLFGALLSVRAEALVTPLLTEALSFCYVLFFPYLLISWIHYAYRGLPVFRKLMVGLATVYGVGFLGYSFIPAAGPHLAFPGDFHVPLGGWAIARFNAHVVENGCNGVDVFPSIHCALSFYLLFFDRIHARWRYRIYLIPCLGIWFATIYLRYHYFADIAAGFLLGGFALWLANRWEKAFPETSNPSNP